MFMSVLNRGHDEKGRCAVYASRRTITAGTGMALMNRFRHIAHSTSGPYSGTSVGTNGS